MIKWAEPTYLWFLLALPVGLVLVFVAGRRRRRMLARAVDPELVDRLTSSFSPAWASVKSLLLLASFAFLLLAAARPKWGEKLQLYRGRGIDVVIALDASKSMFAEDVKPSRMERAKAELASLIDGLTGNNVGIVAFAGDAYVMCPLTTDAGAARMFLDIISPNAMPVPGTDFGRAIDVAMSLFNPKEMSHKALVFVTDGEDLGKNTPPAIRRAVENHVQVYPVAFATAQGAPIPEYDEQGRLMSYKKDKDGQVVMSRMDERELIVMAQATGGRFFRVEGFTGERLLAELETMRKKEIGGGAYTDYVERYQLFLAVAMVLLIAGLALSNRRGAWYVLRPKQKPAGSTQRAGVQSAGVVILLSMFCFWGSAVGADVGSLMRRGNGLFARGKYELALSNYQMAEVLEPDASAIRFNSGNALFRLGRYDEAVRELELATIDKKPVRRAAAMYNIGNVAFKSGQLDAAIKAYTMALVNNPQDMQAKQNLEFCLKKKAEQQDSTGQQQNQQQHQQQQQQQQMQQPRPEMSQDQAERVLQAVEDKEKEQQKKQQQAGGRRKVEQDW